MGGKQKMIKVLGIDVKIQLTSADTDGRYFIFEGLVPPGMGVPPHTHQREDEIFRLIEGEVEIFLGGKTAVVKPGEVCYFPKFTSHGFKNAGNSTARMLFFVSPGANFEKFFEELSALPPGPPDMDKVAAIFEQYKLGIDN